VEERLNKSTIMALRVVEDDEKNPVPIGKLGHPVPEGYIYGNLTLQVWEVLNLRE
jgi:hypothetical protein